jgi:glycosyltransferase involved in cell wall biosynthesis
MIIEKHKMMVKVSINIPTYNNERTIGRTLRSICSQTYKGDIEIIVIDSHSKDKTIDIVKSYDTICNNIRVVYYDGTLLGARAKGVESSDGEFVLLLDSDQILERTAIERAVGIMENEKKDMLWLYERSWKPKKLLEKIYDADRELVQKYSDDFIAPIGGVILPRFYRREILSEAFANMPKEILPLCVAHDHAIIYYEANKLSKRIGKLDHAVWHQEPWSWTNLFKKTYRYGITTRKLIENNAYSQIIRSKNKMRRFYFNDFGLSFKSNVLRVARGIPYKLGYWFGK